MNLQSASYTPNLLNQYTQRTVPGAVPVLGLAEAASTVTVNSGSTYRHGEYFWKELSAANTTVPVWQSVSVQAVHGANNNTVSGNVFVPQTPEAYSYDLDGNLTGDGRWSYTWDAENRLVRLVAATAVGPQQRIDFEYGAGSRRIRKKVWNNTSGTGTPASDIKFLYQGWNLIAELNALSSDAVIRSYVWGNDLSGTFQGAGGVGGLLAVKSSGVCHFSAYDGNGNVIALINGSTGTPSAQYEYGPFGEMIRATGTMAESNPFRFSTKYQDEESGLLYYGYRYYNASTGKWLSRDPRNEDGGPNLFAFVVNNPLAVIDPDGRDAFLPPGYPALPRPPIPPPPVVPPPPKFKAKSGCCTDQMIRKGQAALNAAYQQAVGKLQSIQPATPGKMGATCKDSSQDIIEFLAPYPPCWECYLELRTIWKKVYWPADENPDHQVIICTAYSSSGSQKKQIMFDWWGDKAKGKNNSGGPPDPFRNRYPYNPSIQPRPFVRDCDGTVRLTPPGDSKCLNSCFRTY